MHVIVRFGWEGMVLKPKWNILFLGTLEASSANGFGYVWYFGFRFRLSSDWLAYYCTIAKVWASWLVDNHCGTATV